MVGAWAEAEGAAGGEKGQLSQSLGWDGGESRPVAEGSRGVRGSFFSRGFKSETDRVCFEL